MDHEHTIGVWREDNHTECISLKELAKKHKEDFILDLQFDFLTDIDSILNKEELLQWRKYSLQLFNERWEKYFDWRCNTNLTRFTHCPLCGEILNWKEMKKSNWISVGEADGEDYTGMYGKVKKND